MEPLNLEDLQPEHGEFKLAAFPDRTFRIRPINMRDESWLQKNFPQIDKVFEEARLDDIVRIVFHQLEEDGAAEFVTREVTYVDEDGNKKKEMVGGVQLLRSAIRGISEKLAVFNALTSTIGASRVVQKAVAEEQKKRLNEAMRNHQAPPTGDASSTSSAPSTDGVSSTSSGSPSGSSSDSPTVSSSDSTTSEPNDSALKGSGFRRAEGSTELPPEAEPERAEAI